MIYQAVPGARVRLQERFVAQKVSIVPRENLSSADGTADRARLGSAERQP